MTSQTPTSQNTKSSRAKRADNSTFDPRDPRDQGLVRDDLAYILPMATFLLLTAAGGSWKNLYPASYIAKTIIVAAMLFAFRKSYTRVRWNHWWLGVIVGVVGIFQWVGMQLLLQKYFTHFQPGPDPFNPFNTFSSTAAVWGFIAVRIIGATLVVPVMEELFWRDFAWRTILAPNDFKLAKVGEWGWAPLLIVAGIFATVHGNWWATAIVWALMVGGLLVYTKSLGACIIAHATTNLLLALYVLYSRDWSFW